MLTDSIAATPEVAAAPNIRVVPLAPIFAQAILNIWGGTSVSSLFEHETLQPLYETLYNRSLPVGARRLGAVRRICAAPPLAGHRGRGPAPWAPFASK